MVVLLEWFDAHRPSSKCPSALQSSNSRVAWRHANPLPDNALVQRFVLYVTNVYNSRLVASELMYWICSTTCVGTTNQLLVEQSDLDCSDMLVNLHGKVSLDTSPTSTWPTLSKSFWSGQGATCMPAMPWILVEASIGVITCKYITTAGVYPRAVTNWSADILS